jgi:hypothetical protein
VKNCSKIRLRLELRLGLRLGLRLRLGFRVSLVGLGFGKKFLIIHLSEFDIFFFLKSLLVLLHHNISIIWA